MKALEVDAGDEGALSQAADVTDGILAGASEGEYFNTQLTFVVLLVV